MSNSVSHIYPGRAADTMKRVLSKRIRWWMVLVVVVVGIIAVVQLMSWNFLKPLITDRIQEATGRPAAIHGDVSVGLFPRLQLSVHEVELGNAQWAASPNMLEARRISVSPSFSDLIRGQVVLNGIAVSGGILNLEQRADGPGNWAFNDQQDNQPAPANEESASRLEIRNVSVVDTNIHFRNAESETPLTLSIPSLQVRSDDDALEAQGSLMFRDQTVDLEVKTDPVETFLNDESVFRGNLAVSAGENLEVEAGLERQGSAWRVHDIKAGVAESQLTGELTIVTAGEVPNLGGQLHSLRFDVAALQTTQPESGGDAGFSVPALPDLRGEIAVSVDHLILEQAELENLKAQVQFGEHSVALAPLTFDISGANLEAEVTLSSSTENLSAAADINLQNLDMAELSYALPADDPLDAELSLELEPVERRPTFDLDTLLAHLRIHHANLVYRNAGAGDDLKVMLESVGEEQPPDLLLNVNGTFRKKPLELQVRGAPIPNLVNLEDRSLRPDYPFKADATSDGLSVQVSSTLASILELQSLQADVVLEAESGQALENWIGPVLPPLPDFRVAGHLRRDHDNWIATGLEGVIGDSDLNGHLTIETGASPPRVSGELSSTHLDIADLGVLAGAEPEKTEADDGRALPDTPIITEAWHRVSADVSYRGESVRAGEVPLSKVVIDFVLEDGRGRFDPVGFGIGKGSVDLIVDLDAGTSPPSGTFQVEVEGVDLNDALQNWELADESVGIVGGHGKLWVEGASIAELLASADGGMILVMSGGRLDALLVEIAGLDAGQTILSWVRGRDPIPIDCAYVDLQVRDGVTGLDTFVVDTSDTTFTAGGQVDLNTERLDISLIAHPKDLSVFVGRSPLYLGGTFKNVELAVHREELVMRVGASLGLAALAGPLAAVLPLIDVGTGAEVEYCQGLIRRSQEAIEEEEKE